MADTGIMDRETKFWHPRKPACIRNKSVLINIGLEYFYSALMVLLFGTALSLIILGIEIYVCGKKKKEERKQSKKKSKKNVIILYPFTL